VRISLVHNAHAGDGSRYAELRRLLLQHRHEVVEVVETEALTPWTPLGGDVVVIAGGDGTVRHAATLLAGRGLPLGLVPIGTANNIASDVGLGGSVAAAVAHLEHAAPRPLDLGLARGPWGARRFVEGVGVGLVPSGIAAVERGGLPPDATVEEKLDLAVRTFRKTLARLAPRPLRVSIDGVPRDGAYLLFQVMNVRHVGPNLELAPTADASDGVLDVVWAGEDERAALEHYLGELQAGRPARLALPHRPAHRVALRGVDRIHLDDEVRACDAGGAISIEVEPAPLALLT
jgi:diacylglycerol kinase family enzyme